MDTEETDTGGETPVSVCLRIYSKRTEDTVK